jgi:hypothetical protein
MPGRKSSIDEPFAHLLRGRRRRSSGSLRLATRELWLGIRACGAGRDLAFETNNLESLRKFLALQATLIKTYADLKVPTDLEERVLALESSRAKALERVALGDDDDDDDDDDEMDDETRD